MRDITCTVGISRQVVQGSRPGEVMYVREDGSVLEPEEAARLLAHAQAPGSNILIEEVQVQDDMSLVTM